MLVSTTSSKLVSVAMESSSSESNEEEDVLDLSRQELTKLRRATAETEINTTCLILDHNQLTRLDNVHTFLCLEKLSAAFNSLGRMFQVGKLGHLKILDLSHNNILAMEGLKELRLLVWLNLSSNALTTIENLAHCVHLEHLDLSDNKIAAVNDLSFLKNLNTLLVHRNALTSLRGCDRFLPRSLTTLTLNDNHVSSLTDVQHLQQLNVLEHLVIAGNPAVQQPEEMSKQFDYRPFVINWCLNITSLDGIPVAAKESLKAEWMYSQSRGRQFGSGDHEQLLQYLVDTCPLHPDDDWQEDEKLNLILSKVQEHQNSLHNEPNAVQGSNGKRGRESPLNTMKGGPRSRQQSQHKRTSSVDLISNSSPQATRSNNNTPILRRSTPSRRSVSHFNGAGNRASPSPHRQKANDKLLSGYRVALPKTLYKHDQQANLMTQSMTFEPRLSEDKAGHDQSLLLKEPESIMTTSFDPTLIPLGHQNAWRNLSTTSWTGDFVTPERSLPASKQKLSKSDDSKLLDVSAEELNQCRVGSNDTLTKLMQQRANLVLSSSPRLNPVPESLNSPDTPIGLSMAHSVATNNDNYLTNDISKKAENEGQVQVKSLVPKTTSNSSSRPMTKTTETVTATNSHVQHDQQGRGQSNHRSQNISNPSVTTESNKIPVRTIRKKPSPSLTREIANSTVGSLPRPRPNSSAQQVKSAPNRPLSASKTGPVAARLLSDGSSSQSESEFDAGSRHSTPHRSVDRRRGSHHNHALQQQRTESSSMARSMTTATTKRYAPEKYSSSSSLMTRSTHQSRSSSKPFRPSSSSSRPSNLDRVDAASRIQSAWKGANDVRVRELKQEVRTLRTEEHVKHLSKELQSTKEALEQERKLRTLQMDAIKVLWRELQMMDAIQRGGGNKSRPSGTDGSKISSRSSEHSIAKLMDSLEATAPMTSAVENTTTTVENTPIKAPEVDNESVRHLGATCDRLQSQIETLQTTLDAVVEVVHNELKNHVAFRQEEQRELWNKEAAVQTCYETDSMSTLEAMSALTSMDAMSLVNSEAVVITEPTIDKEGTDSQEIVASKSELTNQIVGAIGKDGKPIHSHEVIPTKESPEPKHTVESHGTMKISSSVESKVIKEPKQNKEVMEIVATRSINEALETNASQSKTDPLCNSEPLNTLSMTSRPSTLPGLTETDSKKSSSKVEVVNHELNSFATTLVESLIAKGLHESTGSQEAFNHGDPHKE